MLGDGYNPRALEASQGILDDGWVGLPARDAREALDYPIGGEGFANGGSKDQDLPSRLPDLGFPLAEPLLDYPAPEPASEAMEELFDVDFDSHSWDLLQSWHWHLRRG